MHEPQYKKRSQCVIQRLAVRTIDLCNRRESKAERHVFEKVGVGAAFKEQWVWIVV